MHNKLFICKVCGHDYGDYIWGEDGKIPSFEICPCCGTEFGYEDASEVAIVSQRQKWLDSGKKWFLLDKKPQNWDSLNQLKNLS